MNRIACYAGQALVYGLLAGLIGYFSSHPVWSPFGPEQGLIKISFSHAGQPVKPCRRRSPEELAGMPPNLQYALDCPRERSPVTVVVELDGREVLHKVLPPTGLRRDGAATLYARLPVAAGRHHLTLKLADSAREPGFRYQTRREIELAPATVFVIGFDPGRGGFLFQGPADAGGAGTLPRAG